jgi:hypothetical protein
VDENYAWDHGYSFSILGVCRTLQDGIEEYVTGPLGRSSETPAYLEEK